MFLLFAPKLIAQENLVPKSHLADSALARTIYQYDKAIERNSMLFTGREYYDGHEGVRGDQFFQVDYWEEGMVEFGGQLFSGINLKYDIYSDQLLVEHFNSSGRLAPLELYKPDVSRFSLFGHKFIQIKKDSLSNVKGGYYDELVDGPRAQLLAKRNKEIIALNGARSYGKEYRQNDKYIIRMDGAYYSVRNKRAALKVFSDKKKALKKFVKSNGLFFSKEKEESFIEMVKYYNSIAV